MKPWQICLSGQPARNQIVELWYSTVWDTSLKQFEPISLEVSLVGKPARISLACADQPSARADLSVPRTQFLFSSAQEIYRLFESSSAYHERHRIQDLGDQLVTEIWPAIEGRMAASKAHCLSISVDRPELHQIPWELATAPDGSRLALDTMLGVERFHAADSGMHSQVDIARPWRILHLGASPENLPALDLEHEQGVLDSLSNGPGSNLIFEVLELATWDEFKIHLADFSPHIVHLSGHGSLERDEGYFCFEDSEGLADSVPVSQLSGLLRDSGVLLVFVSSCDSARTAAVGSAQGICKGLVGGGVPYALGWAGKVDDALATLFTRTFYESLPRKRSFQEALVDARRSLLPHSQRTGVPIWALPVLYTCLKRHRFFPRSAGRSRQPVARQKNPLIGRRREIQKLYSHLRKDENRTAVVNGLRGMGKTALVDFVVPKICASLGLYPVNIKASEHAKLTAERIADELAKAAQALGQSKLAELVLEVPAHSPELKRAAIRRSLEVLPLLVIFDGLEWFEVEPGTNAEEGWLFLLDLLQTRESRSKFVLVGLLQPFSMFPEGTLYLTLQELSERAAVRLLFSSEQIAGQVGGGQLPAYLLVWLVRLVGGIPGLLLELLQYFARVGTAHLEPNLARLRRPDVYFSDLPQLSSAEVPRCADSLESVLTKYGIESRLENLFGLLADESLARLATLSIYRIPVPIEGLQMMVVDSSDRLSREIADWRSIGCLTVSSRSETEVFSVPTPVGKILLEQIGPEAMKEIHFSAAVYHTLAGLKNHPWDGNPNWLESEIGWQQEDFPALPELFSYLDYFSSDWQEHFEEALHHYFAAEKGFDSLGVVSSVLAIRQIDLGQIERAEQLLIRSLDFASTGELLDLLASIYERKCDSVRAQEVYARIVELGDRGPGESGRAVQVRLFDAKIKLLVSTCSEMPPVAYEQALRNLAAEAKEHGLDEFEFKALSLLDKDELGELLKAGGRFAGLKKGNEQSELKKRIHTAVEQILLNEGASADAHVYLEEALGQRRVASGEAENEGDPFPFGVHITQVKKLQVAALTLLGSGDSVGAGRLFQRALDLAWSGNQIKSVVELLYSLAELDLSSKQFDASFQRLGEALRLAKGVGLEPLQGKILSEMGVVELAKGRPLSAREFFLEAAEHFQLLGDPVGTFGSLGKLVDVELALGNLAEAERFARSSLALSLGLDVENQAAARKNLMEVFLALGDLVEAEKQAAEWLSLCLESKNLEAAAVPLVRLSRIESARGLADAARTHLGEAQALLEKLGIQNAIYAKVLLERASSEGLDGNLQAAQALVARCRVLATELCHLEILAEAATYEAQLVKESGGESGRVENLLVEARDFYLTLDQFEEAAGSCYFLADFLMSHKKLNEAEGELDRAISFLQRARDTPPQALVEIELAFVKLNLLQLDFHSAFQRLRAVWNNLAKNELTEGRNELFNCFATLAAEVGAGHLAVFFLGLGVTCLVDTQKDVEESLRDYYDTAEAFGLDGQAESMLECCARGYFDDSGVEFIMDLCTELEGYLRADSH